MTRRRLRLLNAGMAALHLGQGIAMLLLATAFTVPVTAAFLEPGAAGRLEPVPRTLFELRLAPLVAGFLLISALAHLAVSAPGLNGRYEAWLARGINPARWVEYAASSSLMIVVIAMLVGIYDVAALMLAFAANAAMILFGWTMELLNRRAGRLDWKPYWFGVFAGAVPWVAIAIYLWAPGAAGDPPAFVYAIFASIFVFFNVFALNMVLQYRRVGPWRDYRFGELVYVLLSLTAKSALAWQVFAGTLRP